MAILPIDPLETLSTAEAAQRINGSEETLRKWRKERRGIPYLRWGRSIRYRTSDVVAWMEANTVTPGEVANRPPSKPAPAMLQNTARHVPPHLRGMRGFS